ncbi:hypothetical protein P7K49_024457 [Saguinus oedipus]|uniref:Uncharacterized protein n=1 Tax=Saguinus oedipus TaxID=9490 RepID=A0ABQ9UQA3_SAGOE|nr:hypothetical protein P7K49_024457 [Saguinus oedipus]
MWDMQLTIFNRLIRLRHETLGKMRTMDFLTMVNCSSHYFQLGGYWEGGVEFNPPSGLINNFGNKEFDKVGGSEVELVLRKQHWGQALHTYKYDKVAGTACRRASIMGQEGVGKCDQSAAVQHSTCLV